MPQIRPQKARKKLVRQYTPPPDLAEYNRQAKTPQRSAVFSLRAFARLRGLNITREEIRQVSGVAPRIQSRILASKQLRSLYNQPDSGPDPRGHKHALKRSETAAIAVYCKDESIPLKDRGVL